MNVNIHVVHFVADEKLIELVNRKAEKLLTFNDRITSIDVYLKLDNVSHHIKDKIVEIKVHIPKQECFVKTSSKHFETSFEEAYLSVINQLKRKKERQAA